MRRYKILLASNIVTDLDLIAEHLAQSYKSFGDSPEYATARAAARIREALLYLRNFATRPHHGTEQAAIRPGIRTATAKHFFIYVEIIEASSEVRILAIFFGGADHRKQIMERLGAPTTRR